MKLAFFLIALALFISCKTSNDETITNAEQLVNTGNADSASIIISNIHNPQNLAPDLKARYALVLGAIHANRGEALTEDSLLREAYQYYTTSFPQDTARLLQATLLAAQHYWWCNEKTTAHDILENAIPQFKKTEQTAILYNLSKIAEADYNYAQLYKYTKMLLDLNPNNEMTYLIRYNLGLTAYYLNDAATAETLLNDIDKYITTARDSIHYNTTALGSYADILSDYGNQRKAIELQNQVLRSVSGDSTKTSISYASLSRYYFLLGDLNMAKHYMQLADDFITDDIQNDLTYASYFQVMHILLDYTSTRNFNFKELATFINRLQSNAENEHKITNAKEQANRALSESNYLLTIDNQRKQLIVTYAFVAVVALVVILILYSRHRQKIIADKEEELETLRRLIAESQHDKDDKDDRFFKKIMLQQLGVIRIAASNPTTANQELLKRMQEIADKEVTVDSLLNWDDLFKTIDYIYDGYHLRLVEKYGQVLNEKEIQLCCLLRANFSTKEISIVTQQSVRTVYQRKTVIRQKLQLEEKGDIAAVV